jgi:hypothetical protein
MTSYPPPKGWKPLTQKERQAAQRAKDRRTKLAWLKREEEKKELWREKYRKGQAQRRKEEAERLAKRKKKTYDREEIWPTPPSGYSDWLSQPAQRAIYGSGMAANDPRRTTGNPYEGYLRYSRDHYDYNQTGIGWRTADRQLSEFLAKMADRTEPPADPPADSSSTFGQEPEFIPPEDPQVRQVIDPVNVLDPGTPFGNVTGDPIGNNENIIRNSINKPRVTSQTFG